MIAYPDIQRKIQDEIDSVVGRNRLPNISDREHLPYTEATMMEIQRIGSVAPLAVPHYASEDTALLGYNIPKGTIVLGNIWAVHYDPKKWKDPESFCPDRFLNNGVLIDQPEQYLPFSVGKFAVAAVGFRM